MKRKSKGDAAGPSSAAAAAPAPSSAPAPSAAVGGGVPSLNLLISEAANLMWQSSYLIEDGGAKQVLAIGKVSLCPATMNGLLGSQHTYLSQVQTCVRRSLRPIHQVSLLGCLCEALATTEVGQGDKIGALANLSCIAKRSTCLARAGDALSGPHKDKAGSYKKDDLVEYFSSSQQEHELLHVSQNKKSQTGS